MALTLDRTDGPFGAVATGVDLRDVGPELADELRAA